MAQIIVKEKDELKQWNESEFLLTLGNKEDLEFIPKDEAEMDARLESLNVSSNGEYYPSEGYDGFSEVDADVHPTTTRLEVTRNGTYRASSYGVEAFDYVSADCPTGEDEMTLESTSCPSLTSAAAVSSQLLSIPSISIGCNLPD